MNALEDFSANIMNIHNKLSNCYILKAPGAHFTNL